MSATPTDAGSHYDSGALRVNVRKATIEELSGLAYCLLGFDIAAGLQVLARREVHAQMVFHTVEDAVSLVPA